MFNNITGDRWPPVSLWWLQRMGGTLWRLEEAFRFSYFLPPWVHGLRSSQVCTQSPARIITSPRYYRILCFFLDRGSKLSCCAILHGCTSYITYRSKPQSPELSLSILKLEYYLNSNQVGKEGFFYTDSGTIKFIHPKEYLIPTNNKFKIDERLEPKSKRSKYVVFVNSKNRVCIPKCEKTGLNRKIVYPYKNWTLQWHTIVLISKIN